MLAGAGSLSRPSPARVHLSPCRGGWRRGQEGCLFLLAAPPAGPPAAHPPSFAVACPPPSAAAPPPHSFERHCCRLFDIHPNSSPLSSPNDPARLLSIKPCNPIPPILARPAASPPPAPGPPPPLLYPLPAEPQPSIPRKHQRTQPARPNARPATPPHPPFFLDTKHAHAHPDADVMEAHVDAHPCSCLPSLPATALLLSLSPDSLLDRLPVPDSCLPPLFVPDLFPV